jgi:hypothetical protein
MEDLKKIDNIRTWYGRVSYEAYLFRNMEKDEECDYDLTWIDDFSAQGGDKENYSVGEDNSNMCKDAIEKELLQLHVKNDLHEDLKLQSELRQVNWISYKFVVDLSQMTCTILICGM